MRPPATSRLKRGSAKPASRWLRHNTAAPPAAPPFSPDQAGAQALHQPLLRNQRPADSSLPARNF
eukprot:5535-Lingulodinium_polyedra.AAC.1